MNNIWYALCRYDKAGKRKIPRQIRAHRDVSVLEDLKERLEEQNTKEEYVIKTTKEFDKELGTWSSNK